MFDKNRGFDKFWSEFTFIEKWTPSEEKFFMDVNKNVISTNCPLMIRTDGAWRKLKVVDPDSDCKVLYESAKFYKSQAKEKYNSDPEFKKWFDYAVDLSVHFRIVQGIFRVESSVELEEMVAMEETQNILPMADSCEEQVNVFEDTVSTNSIF